MILRIIRKISEFEDIFASGVITPKSIINNTQYNYTFLTTIDVDFEEDEFCIEYILKLDSDFVSLGDSVFAYPRSILILPKNTISIKFKSEKLSKIFSGRMQYLSEIKDKTLFSNKVKQLESTSDTKFNQIDLFKLRNPIIDNEENLTKIINSVWGMLFYSFLKNFTILVSEREVLDLYDWYSDLTSDSSSNRKNNVVESELIKKFKNLEYEVFKLRLNEKQQVVFNFPVIDSYENSIFNFLIVELINRKDDEYKNQLIRLGELIKSDKELVIHLNDYRIFYDIYINGNMIRKITDIKSSVIRSLLIAFLHYKDIRSLDETCRIHSLDNTPAAYIFAGVLMGYANIHGSYIETMKINSFHKLIINEERKHTIAFFKDYYKQILDNQLLLFNDDDLIFRERNRQIFEGKGKFVFKNFRRDILRFQSDDYKVILNEAATKSFIESRKNKPVVPNECCYKSFQAMNIQTHKKLNSINSYILSIELSKYTNQEVGESDEEYPY